MQPSQSEQQDAVTQVYSHFVCAITYLDGAVPAWEIGARTHRFCNCSPASGLAAETCQPNCLGWCHTGCCFLLQPDTCHVNVTCHSVILRLYAAAQHPIAHAVHEQHDRVRFCLQQIAHSYGAVRGIQAQLSQCQCFQFAEACSMQPFSLCIRCKQC